MAHLAHPAKPALLVKSGIMGGKLFSLHPFSINLVANLIECHYC